MRYSHDFGAQPGKNLRGLELKSVTQCIVGHIGGPNHFANNGVFACLWATVPRGEDPLETLDGDKSHISYLSHLAWIVSGYKQLGGGSKCDCLYDKLCETINRRITASPTLNLETYPGECIYIPDMLVAIVALESYSRQNGGKYRQTVQAWLDYMQEYWIDESSGLLASMIPVYEYSIARYPVKGSYSDAYKNFPAYPSG